MGSSADDSDWEKSANWETTCFTLKPPGGDRLERGLVGPSFLRHLAGDSPDGPQKNGMEL
jgi:hypothetical protein